MLPPRLPGSNHGKQPHSRLALVFDKVVLKDKKELPMEHPAVAMALALLNRNEIYNRQNPGEAGYRWRKAAVLGVRQSMRLGFNPNLAGAT